jgi:hypothetical protein
VTVAAIVVIAALVLINPFGSKDSSGGTGGGDGSAGVLEQTVVPPIENVGDRVEFGTWRDKPITWRVLAIEDGQALVISEDILSVRQYDDLGVSSIDQIDWNTATTTWAESDIRAWLNDEFLDIAFTGGEQGTINLSHISNPDNPEYSTEGGAETEDKVFLLSIDEAKRYFSNSGDRIANLTISEEDIQYNVRIYRDYYGYLQENLSVMESTLRANYLGKSQTGWWWLRSPGSHGNNAPLGLNNNYVSIGGLTAAYINDNGDVETQGLYAGVLNDNGGGIRPALWLKL